MKNNYATNKGTSAAPKHEKYRNNDQTPTETTNKHLLQHAETDLLHQTMKTTATTTKHLLKQRPNTYCNMQKKNEASTCKEHLLHQSMKTTATNNKNTY
jgi:hypothetical protein